MVHYGSSDISTLKHILMLFLSPFLKKIIYFFFVFLSILLCITFGGRYLGFGSSTTPFIVVLFFLVWPHLEKKSSLFLRAIWVLFAAFCTRIFFFVGILFPDLAVVIPPPHHLRYSCCILFLHCLHHFHLCLCQKRWWVEWVRYANYCRY